MKEIIILSVMIIITIWLLVKVGKRNAKEDNAKIYGTPIYSDLCNLEYFVRNCTMTDKNKEVIKKKLQYYRARDEMEDVVFNCKVGEIAKIFEKRQQDGSQRT